MFGVSPAFIVSMYGNHFSFNQFCEVLPIISELGFSGYQPEVFCKSELIKWQNEGAFLVNKKAEDLGLHPNQFVAHCLMENFSTAEELFSLENIDDLKIVLDIVKKFPECKTIVIPIGHFSSNHIKLENLNYYLYENLKEALVKKISKYLEMITEADLKFAIEVLPNSIVEGTDGFLDLSKKLNSNNFGISLDTGHAWACRELIQFLPIKLEGKIFGLHICDNDSNINKSLAPGKGTINWESFLTNLRKIKYNGMLDVEIICKPEEIKTEYGYAKKYLQRVLEKI